MSARDRLDTYERDWGRHLKWRNLPTHATSGAPGRYVQEEISSSCPKVSFREIPSELRERVAKRLEECVARLVDEEHAKLVKELKLAAIEEARATLDSLGSDPEIALAANAGFAPSAAKVFVGGKSLAEFSGPFEREG